ncbi:MAG: Rpn family recombination-promoting nuclease/putative transposase [Lachnospiraceae bacterium]|nr:Rpn family recombination-promoting nuclease/putative transposase [Lachnospiraceae bacterium]
MSFPDTSFLPYKKYLPRPPADISQLVENTTGKLRHTLLNDYLFCALLQENNDVLKALICSVLHLYPRDVQTVTITNPILLGRHIDQKTFILDVNVLMNDHTLINLELQVENQFNWPERSLGYLCRSYDTLNKGSDYIDTKPSIHISFLNYTLFPQCPEFHATYKLLNAKNYSLFTDKFQLHVIDLTCTHLVTKEDKRFKLDLWTSFFKARTWEEINMLTKENPAIKTAAETIYQLDNDYTIQWLCQRHQDSVNRVKALQGIIDQQAMTLADKDIRIANLMEEITKLKQRSSETTKSS